MTPDGLARSARVHFARRLLDDTDLTVTEIALAAGFGSLRQFNRASQRGLPRVAPRAASAPPQDGSSRRGRRPAPAPRVPRPARLAGPWPRTSPPARSPASRPSKATPTGARSSSAASPACSSSAPAATTTSSCARTCRTGTSSSTSCRAPGASASLDFDLSEPARPPRERSDDRPAARRTTRPQAAGHVGPVRDRRARDHRPAGHASRARIRSPAGSSQRLGTEVPGLEAFGLTHTFPSAAVLAARQPRRPRPDACAREGDPAVRPRGRRRRRRARRQRRSRPARLLDHRARRPRPVDGELPRPAARRAGRVSDQRSRRFGAPCPGKRSQRLRRSATSPSAGGRGGPWRRRISGSPTRPASSPCTAQRRARRKRLGPERRAAAPARQPIRLSGTSASPGRRRACPCPSRTPWPVIRPKSSMSLAVVMLVTSPDDHEVVQVRPARRSARGRRGSCRRRRTTGRRPVRHSLIPVAWLVTSPGQRSEADGCPAALGPDERTRIEIGAARRGGVREADHGAAAR